jgi:hypothetical protein
MTWPGFMTTVYCILAAVVVAYVTRILGFPFEASALLGIAAALLVVAVRYLSGVHR